MLRLLTYAHGNRFEKYDMLRPAEGIVESEQESRQSRGLGLGWELASVATGSAWTVAGMLDGVRCLRRGIMVRLPPHLILSET